VKWDFGKMAGKMPEFHADLKIIETLNWVLASNKDPNWPYRNTEIRDDCLAIPDIPGS
jgi:hypothetical protein